MEIGRMIKQMDLENFNIKMDQLILVIGKMISRMEKELKNGQMDQFIKVNF